MLKFGFIGFGQVGGMFADLAKTYGYAALAVNTARIDLNVLGSLEKNEKIHLVGYEGAGKDRSVGQDAFLEHQNMLADHFRDKMKSCHLVFPIFALGGGTGSGMAGEATQMLCEMFPDKVISPIVFMPNRSESIRAKMNALEAFTELSSIAETGATFVIDNEKIKELNHSAVLRSKYQRAQSDLLNLLHQFNLRTEMESTISNLDDMDLLTTLSERGSAVLAEIGIGADDTSSAERMGMRLARTFEYSIFATTDYSHIAKSALAIDLPEELTTHLSLESVFDSIGKPLEVFTGIYEKSDGKSLYSLVTGLPYPVELLKELEEDVRKEEKRVVETLGRARSQSFDVKSKWTDSLRRDRKVRV